MTPTKEWIDRHTPSPETLAKIREQRAPKLQQRRGKDTDGDMAMRYLGLCPECNGMVNFGHMFIRRNGTAYHTDCDPIPRPNLCGGCGVVVPKGYSECQGCVNTRMAFAWWGRQMASIYGSEREPAWMARAFR